MMFECKIIVQYRCNTADGRSKCVWVKQKWKMGGNNTSAEKSPSGVRSFPQKRGDPREQK